jgi:hypothetical protein
MTFIVIYARRNSPYGEWHNLVTTGFDDQGNRFVGEALDNHDNIVVLVVPDDAAPPRHFLPTTHLCVHTQAGEHAQKIRAEFTGDAYGFTHQKHNAVFELLKILIPEGDHEHKTWAISVLKSIAAADREQIALLEFCMMKQIHLLCPDQYNDDLDRAKIKIGLSEFGIRLLAEDSRRPRTGESLDIFIERMRTGLNGIKASI